MITRRCASIHIVAVLTALAAGRGSAQEQAQPDFGKMFEALMGAAAQQGQGTEAVEPVNFRDLKAALPEELSGMKRVEATGERNAAMGMNISTARGVYRAEDGGQITIEISDLGGTGGFAAMAQMGFAGAEIDRETETGYERTLQVEGYPGREQYDTRSMNGEFSVFIEKRLALKVEGRKVSEDALKEAREAVDVKKLAELATAAPEEEAEAEEEE